MAPPVRLTLQGERSPEHLSELTQEFAADLRRQTDLDIEEITKPLKPGERSAEVAALGQLALAFLSTGAAAALINCLKAYIERDRTLRFKLSRPDGKELELEAKNLKPDQLDQTLQALERFVE